MSLRAVFIFALAGSAAYAAPVAKHESKPAWNGAPLDKAHQEAAYGFRNYVNTWHDQIPKLDAKGQAKVFKEIDAFTKKVAKWEHQVYVQKPGMGVFDQLYREGEDQWIYNLPNDVVHGKDLTKAFKEVDEEFAKQLKHHPAAAKRSPPEDQSSVFRSSIEQIKNMEGNLNLSKHDEDKVRHDLIDALKKLGVEDKDDWASTSTIKLVITVLERSDAIFSHLSDKDQEKVLKKLEKAVGRFQKFQGEAESVTPAPVEAEAEAATPVEAEAATVEATTETVTETTAATSTVA